MQLLRYYTYELSEIARPLHRFTNVTNNHTNTSTTPTQQNAMSSSAATYLVLVTAGLSVTYLSYMMYAAYGLGALKAVAPFIGSLSIVFGEWSEKWTR